MPFSVFCKTISLFVLIFHIRANELNVFQEPGTQVDTTTSPEDNNLGLAAGSTSITATTSTLFEGITDADALQQQVQDPSNPDVLLLASENPDCAASSSNIIQSPAGRRKIKRLRFRRSGGNGEGVCEWQNFKEDDPETTTTPEDDQQLRGKRRRPKPGVGIPPERDLGPIGPLLNPGKRLNTAPVPHKLDKQPNPQKCPYGQQNIPVCYPKVAPQQGNPALILSPCRTDEPVDPCILELEEMWCCREVWSRVLPNFASTPPDRLAREVQYNRRYPNSASFCIGVLNPPSPPYPIWLWP